MEILSNFDPCFLNWQIKNFGFLRGPLRREGEGAET